MISDKCTSMRIGGLFSFLSFKIPKIKFAGILQVMIDNGFMPEWISLQKEIREDVQRLREKLVQARDSFNSPSTDCESSWEQIIDALRPDVEALNSKIGIINSLTRILIDCKLQLDLTNSKTSRNQSFL